MKILYNNLWDEYTVTPTSENANYPATNTQDPRLSYYTLTSSINNQYWTIDLVTAQDIDCIGIGGHNLTSSATIKIQASDDNFAGGVDFESTITWFEGPIVHFFAEQIYRYWRFYINDPTNTNLYIQVGRFFLGACLAVSPSSEVPFTQSTFDTSKVSFSISGQAYLDKGVVGRIFKYTFPITGNTMKRAIETFYETVSIGNPFFFVNTEDFYTYFEPMYGVIENPMEYEYIGNGEFTYAFNVREVF